MLNPNTQEFAISLKQDLIIEELLIKEYSEVIAKKENLDFLNNEDREEILKIIEILKSDSEWHQKAIINLIKEQEENPWTDK